MARNSGPRVLVVGAGAFGGWSALTLQERGARVTLIDAWGPGHARASSGGETRIIRATYGSRRHYTRLTRRALDLWRGHDRRSGDRLLHETGVLWMFGGQPEAAAFAHESAAALDEAGSALEPMTLGRARDRFPAIDFSGVATVLFEREAGYLLARAACESVVRRFVDGGGTYQMAAVRSPVIANGSSVSPGVALIDGRIADADAIVFAAGPWLPSLFPDLLGDGIVPTRQEVYYFGTPPGDAALTAPTLPVWIEFQDRQIYGIPGDLSRGFKIADDTAGAPIDPTSGDRAPSTEGIADARRYLSRRFPRLAAAPLVGAEVCQYEATRDAELVLDRHPRWPRVYLAGGGSGHGFKMGPAIGELVAALVLDDAAADPRFAVSRFATAPAAGWQAKWT